MGRATCAALTLVGLGGCVVNPRPLDVPRTREAIILLVSTEMPTPIDVIARHAWLVVREKGNSQFERIEFGGFGSGPFEGLGGEELHAIWVGPEAERAIPCLREHEGGEEADIRDGYLPWPGPNSNTFVDRLLRTCGLKADLPATAIGKDHRGLVGVSWTSGGTGAQLETPIAGIRLGLKEGIELHLLRFALGLDLWPPALIVPFGSGRIGFDDRQ